MKFIRDLITEKSKSAREQPDAASDVQPEETPQDMSDFDPPVAEAPASAPFAPLSEGVARMDSMESEANGSDAEDGATDDARLNLTELNDLRRALAHSENDAAPESFEDEMETDHMPEDAGDPAPSPSEPAIEEPVTSVREVLAQEPVSETTAAETPDPEPMPTPEPMEVPSPATGRSNRRSGRVKTRILGFSSPNATETDPFEKVSQAATEHVSKFPVGWLAVVDGPGRGAAFTIFDGVAQIGRGEDQAVRLDFGDSSISRQNHAAIAYDAEQKSFFLGHGGKANLVRLNGRPVLSTEELRSEDTVRIGETTLRFIALCGQNFSWDTATEGEAKNASVG